MKRLFAVGLFALLSINPLFAAPAEEKSENPLTDAPTQYSADLVVSRKVGTPVNVRVYIDGNKRRTEQAANAGPIIILRGDLGKRYILNTGTKTYLELPLDPRMLESAADWSKRVGIVHEKVGTEDINGETCVKYRFSTDPSKAQIPQRPQQLMPRASVTGFIWVAQTTHMLLKMENPVSTTEWKNVKLGAPDASLFELPADYTKQEAPAQFGGQKPAGADANKSGDQKPNEVKPSLSPSPTEEKSDDQKSDGDKSSGDKDK